MIHGLARDRKSIHAIALDQPISITGALTDDVMRILSGSRRRLDSRVVERAMIASGDIRASVSPRSCLGPEASGLRAAVKSIPSLSPVITRPATNLLGVIPSGNGATRALHPATSRD